MRAFAPKQSSYFKRKLTKKLMLKYTKEHEIVKLDGDILTIAITDYAKDALGDLVFIELPEIGKKVNKGQDFAVVESVKIASEIYTPVAGEVVEVNQVLKDNIDKLKEGITTGWIAKIKISDISALNDLMSEEEYKNFVDGLN